THLPGASSPAGYGLLAIAPSAPSTLYAASPDGLFWKTADGGASWQSSRPFNAVIDSIAVDPRNAGVVLAGNENAALLRSTDGGASWTSVITVLPYVTFPAIEFAPGSPDTVYAAWLRSGNLPGGFVAPGGVYKSTDGGATWASAFVGDGTTAIAVDPRDESTLDVATVRRLVPRS